MKAEEATLTEKCKQAKVELTEQTDLVATKGNIRL